MNTVELFPVECEHGYPYEDRIKKCALCRRAEQSFGKAVGHNAVTETINAIIRADMHADIQWKSVCKAIIRELAKERDTFTADDVWEALAKSNAKTHEPRALGAMFRASAEAGFISNTGTYVPSRRPETHSRPIPVWASRLRGAHVAN